MNNFLLIAYILVLAGLTFAVLGSALRINSLGMVGRLLFLAGIIIAIGLYII